MKYLQEKVKEIEEIKLLKDNQDGTKQYAITSAEEFDLRKNVETILSKIVLNEKNKEQILDINWKNTKVQKFTNIESTIKEKLKNEKEAIILVSGSKKYIKIVNEMIERYFNKYRNNKKYISGNILICQSTHYKK